MFIAKISRGRTIREFITYTLTIPCFYTFFWFSVFGGAGITMERKAQNLNISCLMYKQVNRQCLSVVVPEDWCFQVFLTNSLKGIYEGVQS